MVRIVLPRLRKGAPLTRPWRAALAAVLLTALTGLSLVSCSDASAPQVTTGSSVHVQPDRIISLRAPDGLQVTLPIGSTTGTGTLTVTPTSRSGAGSRTIRGWAIHLNHTTLRGKAILAFPVRLAKGEPPPLIGSSETSSGPLTMAKGVLRGGTAVVSTSHFSNWFIETWSSVLAHAKAQAASLWGPSPTSPMVTCPDFDKLSAAGYKAEINVNSAVSWCVGATATTTPLIRIANRRTYPLSLEASPHLHTTDVALRLDNAFPKLLMALQTKLKKGDTLHLLDSGEQQQFDADAGQAVGVNVKASTGALLASDAMFAAETLLFLLDYYAPKKPTTDGLIAAADSADCFVNISSSAESTPRDGAEAAAFLSRVLPQVFTCLGSQIESEFGVKGLVASFLLSGITWLVSGLKLIFQAGQAVWDSIGHLGLNAVTVAAPDGPPLTLAETQRALLQQGGVATGGQYSSRVGDAEGVHTLVDWQQIIAFQRPTAKPAKCLAAAASLFFADSDPTAAQSRFIGGHELNFHDGPVLEQQARYFTTAADARQFYMRSQSVQTSCPDVAFSSGSGTTRVTFTVGHAYASDTYEVTIGVEPDDGPGVAYDYRVGLVANALFEVYMPDQEQTDPDLAQRELDAVFDHVFSNARAAASN